MPTCSQPSESSDAFRRAGRGARPRPHTAHTQAQPGGGAPRPAARPMPEPSTRTKRAAWACAHP
eukprot:1740758-Prymnesium_polylepis.2